MPNYLKSGLLCKPKLQLFTQLSCFAIASHWVFTNSRQDIQKNLPYGFVSRKKRNNLEFWLNPRVLTGIPRTSFGYYKMQLLISKIYTYL
jgi:hypothetical protein